LLVCFVYLWPHQWSSHQHLWIINLLECSSYASSSQTLNIFNLFDCWTT
jgi:hypothetical protein